MIELEEMLESVSSLENETFDDGWSLDSLKDSLKYDYNYILLAYIRKDNIKFLRIKGKVGDYASSTITYLDEDTTLEGYTFAGYLTYSLVQDETELFRVATVPNYRKKGIGYGLIDRYQAHVSDKSSVGFLEVRESNLSARNLYKKTGYKQIAIRKNYYKNPLEDGVIYQITFS